MLKKVHVNQLRLGMHLQSLCGPWMNHPFWKTQFVLKDPADLAKLRGSGVAECWIDVSKGLDVAPADADPGVAPRRDAPPAAAARTATATAAPPAVARLRDAPPAATSTVARQVEAAGRRPLAAPTAELAEEVQRAASLVSKSREAVVSLFSEARMGNALDTSGCVDLVNDVTSSVWRNPGAMLSLARLKSHDDYTYMHSVAVCALMVALARQLGFDEVQAREAGMAGLMHDMGKAAMPLEVLTKPGKLTDAEFALMRAHPERGHAMLLNRAVDTGAPADAVTAGVLDVCLHHHEKVDGSGYPHRLKGDEISVLAKMGAVCDVYDAITSTRPYKEAWDPSESIGKMASWRHGHFDETVFQAFVKSLGIYPVGALVRMQSERLAVVVDQNEGAITSPKVKVFFSLRSQMPIAVEVIDLANPRCNDRILGRESNRDWKFTHLETLWAGPEALRRMGRA